MFAPSFLLRLRHRGVPTRISSLIMIFQRTPLLKLMPEARVISTSGFSDVLSWTVTAITGLGAYDSVSGASTIRQFQPFPDSPTVNWVAGEPLNFVWQASGFTHIPTAYTLGGDVPPGMVQTGLQNSPVDSITGTPTQAGTYQMTVIAWELPNFMGDSFEQPFTFFITNPAFPTITAQPAGGNFAQGAFVSVVAGHTSGQTFTWKLDNNTLPSSGTVLFGRSAARKFITAPATDPGPAWRDGVPFNDASWNNVSGGIGYDTQTASGVNYLPQIASGGNTQAAMFGTGKPVAVHLRMPFTISTPATLSFFKIRVQSDDGFVAWINGTEVASQNKPATFAWNSGAGSDAVDSIAFREIDIPQHLGLLKQGENLLAVQAMNRVTANSANDFLFNCELVAGINATNSPRLVLTSLQTSETGTYTVAVNNIAGSVTSDPVPVLIAPAINQQPASVSIESGGTAQLNVTPSGSPPFSYQWFRGPAGDISNPVTGATDESFMTPALTETTTYWVRVTAPGGSVDSNSATVTVNGTTPDTFTTWKAALFSVEDAANPAVSGPAADPDADGMSNEQEYIFGSMPVTSEPEPLPVITVMGNQVSVTFTARRASGPGYNGRTRHYAIETTTDLGIGPWTAVPLVSDVTGNDQTVECIMPLGFDRTFCRLKIWLTP